jgi:DNA-binding NtrC family response regulator
MQNCSTALLVMLADRSTPLLSQLAGIPNNIRVVSSCEEAGKQLRDDPAINLVLTDLILPDGTWFDVLNLAGECHPGAIVVVCTRVDDERLWTSVLEAGGFDVLVEPWERGEISRVVSAAIKASSQPSRRARSYTNVS